MRRRPRIGRDARVAGALLLFGAVGCDGAGRDVELRDAVIARDGTVLLVGVTSIVDDPPPVGSDPIPGDAWIARTSVEREAQWQTAFGTVALESIESVVELPTEQIVAVGSAPGPVDEDGWILGLRPNGALDFEVLLSGAGAQHLFDAVSLDAGGFAVAGTGTDALGAPGVLVARVGNDGVTSWQTLLAFPAMSRVEPPRILARRDGGLVVVAACDFAAGPLEMWAAEISADGALEAQAVVGTELDDSVVDALLVDDDTALVVAGTVLRPTRSPDPDETIVPDSDVWIAKATLGGAFAWRVELVYDQGVETPARLVARARGGYALLATADGFGSRDPGDTDVWWIEIDADGRVTDQNAVVASDPQRAVAAFEQADRSLFVIGSILDRANRLQPAFFTLGAGSAFGGAGFDGCGRVEVTNAVPTPASAMSLIDLEAVETTSELELLALDPETVRPPPLSEAICDPGVADPGA